MVDERALTPSWNEVVRANQERTVGLVVARTEPCLSIQRDEQGLVPGRKFRPVRPEALAALDLGDSWFIGILLCPGDDTTAVAAWAKSLPRAALWRIRFYHVEGVNVKAALAAWKKADLPEAPTFIVSGFRAFHKLYGFHHGDVAFRDATRAGAATRSP